MMRVRILQRRVARWITSMVVAVLAVGCAAADDDAGSDGEAPDATDEVDEADESGAPLSIVVTTSILGDVTTSLVADDGDVTVLMAPGVDPHAFEPSAQQVSLVQEADLVVANGLRLEEGLLRVLDDARERGVPVLEVAPDVDPLEFEDVAEHDHDHDDDGHDHDDDDHGDNDHGDDDHDHGPYDPHVWFDPVRMADGAELIAAAIAEVDTTLSPDQWHARGETYADELRELDVQIEQILATIEPERRVIVTNHGSLGYFAARYDLEIVGTVIPGVSTQTETDAMGFAALVDAIEQRQVPAIFTEETGSTVLAEQLQSEVEARTGMQIAVVGLYSDSLGEPGSGAQTYPELMLTNAERIADALG